MPQTMYAAKNDSAERFALQGRRMKEKPATQHGAVRARNVMYGALRFTVPPSASWSYRPPLPQPTAIHVFSTAPPANQQVTSGAAEAGAAQQRQAVETGEENMIRARRGQAVVQAKPQCPQQQERCP